MTYEYELYIESGRPDKQKLNEFGADGWELVSVVHNGTMYVCYFKRPIEELVL